MAQRGKTSVRSRRADTIKRGKTTQWREEFDGRLQIEPVEIETPVPNDGKKSSKGKKLGHGAILQVFTGSLAEIEVEVIVNSTGHEMELCLGAVSSSLLNKAGQSLQKACDKLDGLEEGEVKVTKGYRLPCEMVFHVCLPSWNDDTGEQELESIIIRCLLMAAERRAKSISFPALGAGGLGYPPEIVARCFETACKDFASGSSHGTLKTIKVLIFTGDTSTKAGFEKVLGWQLMSADHSEVPDYSSWTAAIDYDKLTVNEEIVVAEETKEWRDCAESFRETLKDADAWEILEVKRVQNPDTYQLYKTQRKNVARKLGSTEHEVERTLWHGTKQKSVKYIARHKFDRGYAGTAVGALHGKGCYFAVNAQHSVSYCQRNKDGEKFMIRVKVITGEYTKGEGDMITAPYKDNSQIEQYDSVVDDETEPKLFVTFHDASAYPEYIIKFRHAASYTASSPPSTPSPRPSTPSSPLFTSLSPIISSLQIALARLCTESFSIAAGENDSD